MLLAAVAAAVWLWYSWCVFPSLVWNEIRLEPSFLLATGNSVYPGPGQGPVTTWIYGPLTVLLLLPATLTSSATAALMTAGAINLCLVVAPIVLVSMYWPVGGRGIGRLTRMAVALVCLAAWPYSSLQYIQADNAAVACALLSNLVLVRSGGRLVRLWMSAMLAVAAVASKQTALGCVVAQLLWMFWTKDARHMLGYAARIAALGALTAVLMLVLFTPAGLWLNMYELPRNLPFTPEWLQRTKDLTPLLTVHLLGPAAVLWFIGRAEFERNSALLLPSLTWLAALLPGLLSLYKIGGTINSLEGWPLFMPAGFVALSAQFENQPRTARMLAMGALAVFLLRLQPAWRSPMMPRIAHIRNATTLVQQHHGQLWFPWNPIITFFADHRFDHVEDGMYVRFLAGRPLSRSEALKYLPPDWKGMAILRGSSDWGIATHLCPPGASVIEGRKWTLYQWGND